MSDTLPLSTSALDEQAISIATDIFNLTNQYTHDSSTAKFFLSDELARVCYGLAGGFASVMYTPALKPKQIPDTHILSFLYALMTYGFNIYLKERSQLTYGKPYRLPTDIKVLKNMQAKTLDLTTSGDLLSTPLADKIISIISENIRTQIDIHDFHIQGHRLSKKKFADYNKLALYWGYNYARELLQEAVSH
jgi:hypothetical protein